MASDEAVLVGSGKGVSGRAVQAKQTCVRFSREFIVGLGKGGEVNVGVVGTPTGDWIWQWVSENTAIVTQLPNQLILCASLATRQLDPHLRFR